MQKGSTISEDRGTGAVSLSTMAVDNVCILCMFEMLNGSQYDSSSRMGAPRLGLSLCFLEGDTVYNEIESREDSHTRTHEYTGKRNAL